MLYWESKNDRVYNYVDGLNNTRTERIASCGYISGPFDPQTVRTSYSKSQTCHSNSYGHLNSNGTMVLNVNQSGVNRLTTWNNIIKRDSNNSNSKTCYPSKGLTSTHRILWCIHDTVILWSLHLYSFRNRVTDYQVIIIWDYNIVFPIKSSNTHKDNNTIIPKLELCVIRSVERLPKFNVNFNFSILYVNTTLNGLREKPVFVRNQIEHLRNSTTQTARRYVARKLNVVED